jgi:hypothetical protein
MLKPLSPPDLTEMGALTFPRELQRWLDVNPVTKLTRVAGYITLPVFNVNVSWLGYSDIVAAFNYEGPNWFSLKEFSTVVPLNPNYMLCIAYVKNGITYRYSLWRGVGEIIFFSIPMYTGQAIGKNFRFEVWSTEGSLGSTLAISNTGGPVNGTYTQVSAGAYYQTGGGKYALIYNWKNLGPFWYLFNTSASTNPIAISDTSNIVGTYTAYGGGVYTITFVMTVQASQATSIALYTSVLGSIDYRYSSDFTLVNSDAICTNFQSNFNMPYTWPAGAYPQSN